MDNNNMNKQIEKDVPAAVVTMCLAGYRDTIKKLSTVLIITVVCWLCTVGGFLWYLSQYEVEVTTYGNFENSKVNANKGIFEQQAQTITNNGVDMNGENIK